MCVNISDFDQAGFLSITNCMLVALMTQNKKGSYHEEFTVFGTDPTYSYIHM